MPKIIDREIVDDIEKSFIDYSMSVLCDRSVPDVRDGCKPIHRRILWAMYNLHNTPDKPYKKSARIVGETMGKYHPHGDCYDADTKIYLLDGTIKTIKELTDIGKEQWILAVDEKTNKVVPAKAHSFRIGQYATKVYTIRLSNGYELKVTGNHPFRLTNGTWVKAENLQINQVIDFIHLNVGSDGYLSISSPHKEQGYEKLHCLVSDCCGINGEVIHHRDGNRFNNKPDNLLSYSRAEHAKYFDKDFFVIFRNDKLPIISDIIVSEYDSAVPMYDFTVDDYHNMFIPANDDNSMLIVGHNSSIYGAAVRMAQDFSLRYPLIDGHGNFGSQDGDSAASQRYTEMRMSEIAVDMIGDIQKDVVDFVPNFDGEVMEPSVLPSKFPNLLLNGSSGIAVGFTTNIPPHNLCNVIDACLYLIDNPVKETSDELISVIKAPDFPTGGIILNYDEVKNMYKTGKGKFTIRAKCEIEEASYGKHNIIVTEIPYGVNKAKLVESISDLVTSRKIEGISELRDETSRDGLRIFIEVKKNFSPNVVLNKLFQYSELQINYSAHILALSDGVPKIMDLYSILRDYLDFQQDVIVRRIQFDLAKSKERLHILEGLLKALDNIDTVIKIIRNSSDNAKENLMKKLKLTDVQAQAILDMRLARLQKLEAEKLKKESKQLSALITKYENILKSPKKQMKEVRKQLVLIRETYGDERLTDISEDATSDFDIEDIIEDNDCYVYVTAEGYINRISDKSYQKYHEQKVTSKSDDAYIHFMKANTRGFVLIFTDKGNLYKVPVNDIPEMKSEKGSSLRDISGMMLSENVSGLCYTLDYSQNESVLAVTNTGYIKRCQLSDYMSDRRSISYIKLDDDMSVVSAWYDAGDNVILTTRNRKAIKFDPSQIRAMGRAARGVSAISLEDGDEVVFSGSCRNDNYISVLSSNGYFKKFMVSDIKKQARGGKGLLLCDNVKAEKFGTVSESVIFSDSLIANENGVYKVFSADDVPLDSRSGIGKNGFHINIFGTIIQEVTL